MAQLDKDTRIPTIAEIELMHRCNEAKRHLKSLPKWHLERRQAAQILKMLRQGYRDDERRRKVMVSYPGSKTIS